MKTKVFYEWIIETTDEYGDVVNVEHFNNRPKGQLAQNEALALVRDLCEVLPNGDAVSVIDREWAYVNCNKLPSSFDGGSAVPLKFFR